MALLFFILKHTEIIFYSARCCSRFPSMELQAFYALLKNIIQEKEREKIIQIDDRYLVYAFPFDAGQEEQQIKGNVVFIAQCQCEHFFVQNGIDHSLQTINVRIDDGLIE